MKRYLIFVVIIIAILAVSISSTMVAVAFPQLVKDFNTSLIIAGWVLSIAQLTNVIAMPLLGKASDAIGRKKTFLISAILFTAGSLLCALAPNVGWLIFFRFIQGFGIGGFLPACTAIVAEEFPDKRQQLVGFFSSIFPLGQIIGPIIGGWFTEVWGWRSTFWFSLVIGALTIIAGIILLRKSLSRGGALPDLVGAGMLSGIVTAAMLGISLMGNDQAGVSWWGVGLLFALAVIFTVAFLRRQTRVKDPIIDVQILREKPFMAANAFNFFYGVTIMGFFYFIPLYAVSIFNVSTLDSGLITTPRSIAMAVASTVVAVNLMRWGYRKPIVIGMVFAVFTFVVLALRSPGFNLLGWQISGVLIMIVILFFSGMSQGIIAPASNNACIELLPEKVGVISGVRGMFRQVGMAISINIIALVIHNTGDIARGFTLVFIGLAVISLLYLPVVFLMPRAPTPLPEAAKV